MAKLRFRAKANTKYMSQRLQARSEREDDQIAPEVAAHSIDALERWALHTANIRQGRHKPNEAQTVERIHDRYVNEDVSVGSHEEIDQKATWARSDRPAQDAASKQRMKHSMSPTESLQLDAAYSKDTFDSGVRGEGSLAKTTAGQQPKRKRRRRRSSNRESTPRKGEVATSEAAGKEVKEQGLMSTLNEEIEHESVLS